jgi:hypothetical protein
MPISRSFARSGPKIYTATGAATVLLVEIDIELGGGNRHHVIAALRTAQTAADLMDTLHREDLLLDDIGDAVHFLKRGAGRGSRGDERGLLLELRQEVLVHRRIERERRNQQREGDEQHHPRLAEGEAKHRALQQPFHAPDQTAVLVLMAALRMEKEGAKYGNHRE